jgi:putative flippase GtrA
MTAVKAGMELAEIRIRPETGGVAAFPSRADAEVQIAGLDALASLALTQPLRAVDAEMLGRPKRASRGNAHHSDFRHFASRAWEQRLRLLIFATNGLNVFAVGLLIQVILVRYADMDHITSYIVQTIASVQLNFLLSRYVTWRDRDVAFLGALAKFNLQQLVVTGFGIAGYAGLERLGVNYIAANVVVTGVLAPASFLSSHLWSLTDRAKDPQTTDPQTTLSGHPQDAWPDRAATKRATGPSPQRVPPGPTEASLRGNPTQLRASGKHARQHAAVDALADLTQRRAKAWPVPVAEFSETVVREPVTAAELPTKVGKYRQRRFSSKIPVVAAVSFLAVTLWAAVHYPPMRYLVFVAWMVPLAELALLVTGQVWFRFRYREAPAGKFTRLIIQVTTAGHEHERVSEIITQIRDYRLEMDYQIWVVTEPGSRTDYPLADLVLTVPLDFSAKSAKKARALEYSRRVRVSMGLDRADVKILFNDDDVSLTRGYIERAFAADYDICEGIVTPRTCYAVRPFGHFAISHADDIRTHACLVYCSVFQGILNRPVHVHGEGMTVTGEAEGIVTWDIPLIASEDLAFGQWAARAKGLRWGWFHEYAEVTSPWSVRDFMIQRSRWLWGDIHAVRHRDVMPFGAAVMVTAKYIAGVVGLAFSAAGLYLRATGRIPATSPILSYAKLSILSWVGVIFACGWIGAGSATSARNDNSRLLAGVLAVLMMPISVALTFAAVLVPLAEGDPRTFRVIRKTRSAP